MMEPYFFRLQFRKLIERTKYIRNHVFSLFSLLIADYIVKDTIIWYNNAKERQKYNLKEKQISNSNRRRRFISGLSN